jgi:hypothetical protein
MVKGIIFYIALFILLISPKLFGVEVTTDNLLSNSTFGTGTTYSTDGWTISDGTSGHNYTSSAGGNDPGGAVASTNNTSITQTVDSLVSAAEMTVPEIQKGWSSTMSTDLWFWNQYNNTTTLKQTITDSAGNVTIQKRIISDTGCGSINCGQYTNYTDKHIQGANTNTDFSIGVNVSNSNSRSGHYGPDIDDVQLKVTYTDVPPIDTSTQEIIDDIEEDIEFEEDFTWEEDIALEENFYFEEEVAWEEDFYFEEEFDMEEYMTMDFEDQWVDMEFEDEFVEMEFEDEFVEMEFEEMNTAMNSFDDMYMEELEEFEEFEDAWGMEPEMTEMDTFFTEMSDDEWEEFEEMSEDEFTEFLEEEFPEEFVEMQEEMEESNTVMEEEMPMEEPEMEEEMEVASNEEDDMMTEEPETEMEEPENEEVQNEEDTKSTEEPKENVEEESENEDSPSEVAADEEDESDSEAVADAEVQADGDSKQEAIQKAEVKGNRKISIDQIKVNKVNVERVTLFSDQGSLDVYETVAFYQPEQIYTNVDTSFFDQIDMVEYNKQIYQNVSLASYTDNDPVEVHRKNMERIDMEKQRLLIELRQLRNQ